MKDVRLFLPGAVSAFGGIETYDRQRARDLVELGRERSFTVSCLVLNDVSEDVDGRYVPRGAEPPRGFRRGKPRFATAALCRKAKVHLDFSRTRTPPLRAKPRGSTMSNVPVRMSFR